jgi:mycothiol synthase
VPEDPAAPGHRFAVARGFRYHSSLWLMRLRSGQPAQPAAFPDGLIVRWFEPGSDDEPYVALINESFADHPSPLRVTLGEIRHIHSLPDFDRRMVLVVGEPGEAGDPERFVGFAVLGRYDEDGRRIGDIRMVGVRPEARGRGLGRELLRWGIAELRARGAVDVELSVEGANDRALGLYRRAGFEPVVEWRHWTLPLDG